MGHLDQEVQSAKDSCIKMMSGCFQDDLACVKIDAVEVIDSRRSAVHACTQKSDSKGR